MRYAPRSSFHSMAERFDFLIVGAGFAGAVLAERIATQLGKTSLVIDRQSALPKIRRSRRLRKKVTFVGCLATYRYYNMEQVVGLALGEFEKLKKMERT